MNRQLKQVQISRETLSPINPNKLPYAQVAMAVELLQAKPIAHNDQAINEHITLIAELIRAMGWDENEYSEAWMKENGDPLTSLLGDLPWTQDQPS